MIVTLKPEYKKDLYDYAYELLLKQEGYNSTNFFRASNLIEFLSDMAFDSQPKNEWKAIHYWYFLSRKELKKEVVFNGIHQSQKNQKLWKKEMSCIFYYDLKYDLKEEKQQQKQQQRQEQREQQRQEQRERQRQKQKQEQEHVERKEMKKD